MDDEEELLFQPSISIVPPEQSTATIPSVNTEVISNGNSSKSSQKEVISNEGGNSPSSHVYKNHPSSSFIGDPSAGITTRKKDKIDYAKLIANICYTSSIEPTSINEAFKDDFWINAMQEELLQFQRNNLWTLVPKPDKANIVGTKWILKNKTDEKRSITKNKARLVAQDYSQVEGVDFDETYALVATLKAICLLLSISCIRKFKLYQMDVKSSFLNGYLNEEVYVAQPKGFIDPIYPQYVYKLNKTLYWIKQAPRAWYEQSLSILVTKDTLREVLTRLYLSINLTRIRLLHKYMLAISYLVDFKKS
ncbi:hypothetical protein IC575_003746 [Cucumis melo]